MNKRMKLYCSMNYITVDKYSLFSKICGWLINTILTILSVRA